MFFNFVFPTTIQPDPWSEVGYTSTTAGIGIKQKVRVGNRIIYKREQDDIEIGDFRSRKNILAALLIPFLHFLVLLSLILIMLHLPLTVGNTKFTKPNSVTPKSAKTASKVLPK